MPQLDILSYMSQLLWFLLIFGLIYLFLLKYVLPELKKIQMARIQLIQTQQHLIKEETPQRSFFTNFLKNQNQSIQHSQNLTQLLAIQTTKNLEQTYLTQLNKSYFSKLTILLIKTTNVS